VSRLRAQFLLALLVTGVVVCAGSQKGEVGNNPAEVQALRVVVTDSGPVLEIVSTRPLRPALQTVESPLRLVIDLPNSKLNIARRKIPFRNPQINGIRVNQYQSDPAVTRVVVDLSAPVRYTWDAMGNRLYIRLHADEVATAKPLSVPSFSAGVQPAAVPMSVGASGSLVEVGNRVASGSSITAGDETAILRLTRGGEVHVCPRTTVTVSTSANGQDLLLGMSQGTLETHYLLQSAVDSVLTPDFRIVLPGPGEFNLAISADTHGNTCVASLPGSTSSAVIAELLGSGTYEIKPDQHFVFRQGRLQSVETAIAWCGCPPTQQPVMRASSDPPAATTENMVGEELVLANSAAASATQPSTSTPVDAAASGKQDPPPGKVKVLLEAPLVFSGRDQAKSQRNVPEGPLAQVAALPLTARVSDPLPAIVVLPPADSKANRKGFFKKVGGFLGGIFR
jgi:AMIN domain